MQHLQQLSECNFKMITCLFSTHYFQFHNKILNSSKFLFISNYKSCNLQISIILKILLFFVGNIYKKEKEKKSLCCTSPLIRGDELFTPFNPNFIILFFKLLMSPPNSFVVSSLLSLKRSVFGTGLSKRMLQVWHHMALCGQSGGSRSSIMWSTAAARV